MENLAFSLVLDGPFAERSHAGNLLVALIQRSYDMC